MVEGMVEGMAEGKTPEHIKIGTRQSKLALWQANWTKSALEDLYPGIEVELVKITTKGDRILDAPLAKVGGKGLFVKEIEEALLEGRVDLAVHSMKDMPAEIPEGLIITVTPRREDPCDALISKNGHILEHLPKGAGVGTSSLRRAAQLLALRPDLKIKTLRGNIDTRLKKLDEGQYDAIILAAAGLKRMGWKDRITQFLAPPDFLPAVGQGALAIETRADNHKVRDMLEPINHLPTMHAVTAERAFLATLEGGCQVPIAGHAVINDDGNVFLTGLVAGLDGKRIIRGDVEGGVDEAGEIGEKLAHRLLESGAREILDEVYGA